MNPTMMKPAMMNPTMMIGTGGGWLLFRRVDLFVPPSSHPLTTPVFSFPFRFSMKHLPPKTLVYELVKDVVSKNKDMISALSMRDGPCRTIGELVMEKLDLKYKDMASAYVVGLVGDTLCKEGLMRLLGLANESTEHHGQSTTGPRGVARAVTPQKAIPKKAKKTAKKKTRSVLRRNCRVPSPVPSAARSASSNKDPVDKILKNVPYFTDEQKAECQKLGLVKQVDEDDKKDPKAFARALRVLLRRHAHANAEVSTCYLLCCLLSC